MKRNVCRKKMLEFARRVYFSYHGTYKGFGSVARFYNDTWHIDTTKDFHSYSEAWNCKLMRTLRNQVGM